MQPAKAGNKRTKRKELIGRREIKNEAPTGLNFLLLSYYHTQTREQKINSNGAGYTLSEYQEGTAS